MRRNMFFLVGLIFLVCAFGSVYGENVVTSPYVKWENGPLHSADFFPIAVWLQTRPKHRGIDGLVLIPMWVSGEDQRKNSSKT